jgi:hypothetical protein
MAGLNLHQQQVKQQPVRYPSIRRALGVFGTVLVTTMALMPSCNRTPASNAQKTAPIVVLDLQSSNNIEAVLSGRINVNSKDKYGRTALRLVVSKADSDSASQLDTLNQLLKLHADVNSRADDSTTVLMGAVQTGNMEIVRTLAKKGAKIDATDSRGRAASIYAIDADYPEIADSLDTWAKSPSPATMTEHFVHAKPAKVPLHTTMVGHSLHGKKAKHHLHAKPAQ